MSTPLIIGLVVYVIGALYWSVPGLQDAWASLQKKEYAEFGVFLVGVLIVFVFWVPMAIYKGILYLPELIERLPAP